VWEEEILKENLEKMIMDLKALPMESIKYFKDLTNAAMFFELKAQLEHERTVNCDLVVKASFKERLERLFAGK
jgi:hypothetical protein